MPEQFSPEPRGDEGEGKSAENTLENFGVVDPVATPEEMHDLMNRATALDDDAEHAQAIPVLPSEEREES